MSDIILKIVAGAFAGTSLMTAYSYYRSHRLNRQFKEPKLLNTFLNRSELTAGKQVPPVSGWLLHYAVGLQFIVLYHIIWELTAINPSVLSGSLMGLANGFAGIAGWALLFRLHNNPPSVDLSKYYLHLIIAHIIFGASGTAAYMLVD